MTAIIDESGSDKSTFLHCVARLYKSTSGNIYLRDKDIYEFN